MVSWWMHFNGRVPEFVKIPRSEYYRAMIDLSRYADQHGCKYLMTNEHHQAEDGYMTDALMVAAALAAVTDRAKLRCTVILPLHDPIRAAERTIILDLLSNGRAEVIIGAGYMRREFDLFQVPYSGRAQLLEKKLSIYLQALAGSPFEYFGSMVHVRPKPVQRPAPLVFLGGTVAAVARRAALFGVGFNPIINNPDLIDIYRDECLRLGKEPGPVIGGGKMAPVLFLADNVNAEWERLAPYLLHEVNIYAKWAADAGTNEHLYRPVSTITELKALGMYQVVTPAACIQIAQGGGEIVFNPLAGGIPPTLAWENLRCFVERVLPQI
jgi:alkanesulfonate monooxygenase SsuD/methylene tetrahydromethanopterin reductase-like flavin-dependent oxidoreductase (luciferase family)